MAERLSPLAERLIDVTRGAQAAEMLAKMTAEACGGCGHESTLSPEIIDELSAEFRAGKYWTLVASDDYKAGFLDHIVTLRYRAEKVLTT